MPTLNNGTLHLIFTDTIVCRQIRLRLNFVNNIMQYQHPYRQNTHLSYYMDTSSQKTLIGVESSNLHILTNSKFKKKSEADISHSADISLLPTHTADIPTFLTHKVDIPKLHTHLADIITHHIHTADTPHYTLMQHIA